MIDISLVGSNSNTRMKVAQAQVFGSLTTKKKRWLIARKELAEHVVTW